ncbi:MAG: MotA/TolQ/ExbB proton channel family protein [Pseudomonadota bacterium]
MGEIYGFLAKGGPVMVPIMLGSIIALAIFLERMWVLRKSVIAPDGFTQKVNILLKSGKRQEAITLCQSNQTPLARILLAIIGREGAHDEEIQGLVEDMGKRESLQLGRYVEALGTIAAVEPLLGLLGTVTGLIRAFQQVVYSSGQGAVDPSKLATGIWEALITTAAGLIVAIPCYIGYKYLAARADSFTAALEEGASTIYQFLKFHKGEVIQETEEAQIME